MTDTQTLLDKDVQIEELARRVEVLEAALRPFADGNIDVSGAAVILGYPECKEALRVARDALSTPSVGGSLAEENERLREALRPFAQVAECDIGSDEADGDTYRPMDVRYANAEPIKVGHLRRAFAALAARKEK